jgi:hypothetical protein
MFTATLIWSAEPVGRNINVDVDHQARVMAAAPVEHVVWDGNQISTVHGNHGDVVSYHISGNSGLEWPKGSGKLAVFQSGIWLASGRSRAPGAGWVDELRTAAAEYTVEFVPGSIGSTDENSGHIYQIHKKEVDAFLENDWATFQAMTLDLPITVVEGSSAFTEDIPKSLPTDDFINWPVGDGAPWKDVNGDGEYKPADGDHPDILGDVFHWYVMNDGDAATHTPLWGTSPMNVDIQTSLFGFNQAGPMGNILFVRWVMINRGSDELDSVFVSMWHDDDVGDATDDLVGCNVDLSVGYTYNDADGDNTYGVEVPAAGADFFQGPLVNSAGDSATIFTWSKENGYHLRTFHDKKKLGMTSFAKYINGDPIFSDPENAQETYNYMNGLVGTTGEPFIDPTTDQPSIFVHDGDPTTGAGWIDDVPGDRRYLMTSGPFYFAPGDTQEVVGALILAAGSNWAKSITKMLYFDNFAQGAFDANFNVCSPPSPIVELAQLDQKVVLSFEDGSDIVEGYDCGSYGFQGYNIYQGASLNGPWTRVGTYDIVDGTKIILDLELDENTGELLELPSQFGTDSGLKHFIEITYDKLGSRDLINNRKYYFAVTAFAYDPDAAKRVIESPINAIVAVPGVSGVGAGLANQAKDTLAIVHTGQSDALFDPIVVDPYQLTGESYTVSFDVVDSVTYWFLKNTSNDVLATDMIFPATEDYFATLPFGQLPFYSLFNTITDGFIVTARNATFDPPMTYSSAETIADDFDSTALVFGGLNSAGTWAGFLEPTNFENKPVAPGAESLQLDIEFRFTDGGSVATHFNASLTAVDTILLPFEVWSIEEEKQINAAIYQVSGNKELYEADPDFSGSYNFRKNFFIIPVYESYTGTGMADYYSNPQMGWMIQFDKANTSFESGNIFRVSFVNPLFPGVDTYTIDAAGYMATSGDEKDAQLEAVNVFPNPYFGQNPEERNQLNRFVYFTNLGVGKTTIRIFTISGDLIRVIEKSIDSENSADRRVQWDLRNSFDIPVASGMYIAHLSLGDDQNESSIGEKVMKLAVFMPEERLDVY